MSHQKKRLVILGGGLAGLPLARHIEKNKKLSASLDVTLVDKKHYFELTLAAPRFLVDPEQHAKYTALYETYLKTTRFVCGEVRVVQAQPQQVEVATEHGTEFIPYDYLVICTGTRYQHFKAEVSTLHERTNQVSAFSQQVQNANHILVVGGRSVGAEIVGEILEQYPAKQITIVHPAESLMDGWPKSGIAKLNKFMKGKGNRVNVVLGKKVTNSEGNRHELSDGSTIEADLKISATGVVPNSESLRSFFGTALSPAGYVKVRGTLQLEGFGNIFAFGDIADLDQPKMAANLKAQIELVLKNLQVTVADKGKLAVLGDPMMKYPGLVTLGPSYGILALPVFGGSSMGGKFISNMKTNMFAKIVKEM
eukprot:Phypoly_transcript_09928.p1 GENE.Phypoly_transcript_09928~~Phypoly_transcript_09928.p1  ORF type:complete len:366 (-),score=65.46 Phypoly_transcript_09928:121-1218(-)